jgi:tagaturonate reductase
MDRVLQFGTGRFLRGFVEAFIDEIEGPGKDAGEPPRRRVTVVETTGSGMAGRLAAQDFAYVLHTRGLEHGAVVDASRLLTVIDRGVDASEREDELIEAALDPDLRAIVSNTTEQGYALGRFPRLLATILAARARAQLPGLVILPCELIERNGDRLRKLVSEELALADEGPTIVAMVDEANAWATTMVDRIVTAASGADDSGLDLGVVVEPYASWVIETPADVPLVDHPSVTRTADVTPYVLRKVRILNGAHTALVVRTRGSRYQLVREALDDQGIADWLESLMREEIVPALGDRVVDGDGFVSSVLERLRNPFLDHRLSDIAVNQQQKVSLRLRSTHDDYVHRFGRAPRLLSEVLDQAGVTA